MGVWLRSTFHATPLPLCHETSVCSLQVSALIRGSLPRPWGEGGRRPGEGQPRGIAPQNVQTRERSESARGMSVDLNEPIADCRMPISD